jgi:hypothetical protein
MDGRVSDGDRVMTLDVARQGGSMRMGEHWQMPLGDHARGKVTVGELTLLFQFVTEPPVQPRPMLPHSVRGTLADRLDPQLMICLAVSITFHFGFMLWALLINDPDTGDTMAERAAKATFQEESYEVRDEFVLPQEPSEAAGETKEQPKAEDKPRLPTSPRPAARRPSPPRAAVARRTTRSRCRKSPRPTPTCCSPRTRPAPASPATWSGASPAPTSASSSTRSRPRASGPRSAAVPRAVVRAAAGPHRHRHRAGGHRPGRPHQRAGRRQDRREGADRPHLGVGQEGVRRELAHARRVCCARSSAPTWRQRYHKDLLKTDPTARGKVKLAFTVNPSNAPSAPRPAASTRSSTAASKA